MLPDLTHLQILVLKTIANDAHTGRFIRDKLAEEGEKKSGPAFYQLMSRLEDVQLVSGWYETQAVFGQTIKERHYRTTIKGRRLLQSALGFYQELMSNCGNQDQPVLIVRAH